MIGPSHWSRLLDAPPAVRVVAVDTAGRSATVAVTGRDGYYDVPLDEDDGILYYHRQADRISPPDVADELDGDEAQAAIERLVEADTRDAVYMRGRS